VTDANGISAVASETVFVTNASFAAPGPSTTQHRVSTISDRMVGTSMGLAVALSVTSQAGSTASNWEVHQRLHWPRTRARPIEVRPIVRTSLTPPMLPSSFPGASEAAKKKKRHSHQDVLLAHRYAVNRSLQGQNFGAGWPRRH